MRVGWHMKWLLFMEKMFIFLKTYENEKSASDLLAVSIESEKVLTYKARGLRM